MYIKYLLNVYKKKKVTFKIIIENVFDQMVILKVILFFVGHLMYY
jgi:hypothetical protein